jgi:hypothetical protein
MGDSIGAPADCRPAEVVQRFNELLSAMGRGDTEIVEKYFGGNQPNNFFWVSIEDRRKSPDPKLSIYTKSRDSLAMYFQSRPYQGQEMHVTSIAINVDTATKTIGFSPVQFDVNPSDSSRRGYGGGKGGYHCATRSFSGFAGSIKDIVWITDPN